MKSSSPSKLRIDMPAREKPAASEDASPEELARRLQAASGFTGDAKAGAANVPPPAAPVTTVSHEVKATGGFPWLSANPKVIKGYSLRLPEPMMQKLEFLKANEPNTSVHKLILAGIAKELDARLPKYGWTEPNAE